jgi:hypothetical protein
MSAWPPDELHRIAETDDLHVSPFRDDATTYGTPTWIWSVVVDDALYVRAYSGTTSRWYQAAMRQKAGRITAAYRAKYADSPYLAPMLNARARSATVRVQPRNDAPLQ